MDDERPKPSLADDPNFLASLGDLDHGLGAADAVDEAAAPSRPVDKRSARPAAIRLQAPQVWTAPVSAPDPAPAADAAAETNPIEESLRRSASPGPERRRRTFATFPAAAAAPLAEPYSIPEAVSPTPAAARRPLLDLFPPSSLTPERPRGPSPGDAPPPRLPPARARRATASLTPDPVLTYEPFYGLDERPFGLSTDPKFVYHSTAHDRVMQELADAISRGDRVMTLTGEIGTGKTTLCRALVGQSDRRTLTSLVVDPLASVDELLTTVLVDFGVMSRDDLARTSRASGRPPDLRAALAEFLASLASLQASAVLIIDEAQNISGDIYGQLRAWTDGDTGQRRLQVLLVGQPSLSAVLRRPGQRSLDQRIQARCQLGPLLRDEVAGYVMHRLSMAGSSVRVEFDDGAFNQIYAISRGVPRLVNLICDRALTRGHEASASVIDDRLVTDAADDLDLTPPRSRAARAARMAVTIAVLAALTLLGAAGAAWLFRDRVQQAIIDWRAPASR